MARMRRMSCWPVIAFLAVLAVRSPREGNASSQQLSTSLMFSPQDLNDMILPEEACVLPLKAVGMRGDKKKKKKSLRLRPGSAGAPITGVAPRVFQPSSSRLQTPTDGEIITKDTAREVEEEVQMIRAGSSRVAHSSSDVAAGADLAPHGPGPDAEKGSHVASQKSQGGGVEAEDRGSKQMPKVIVGAEVGEDLVASVTLSDCLSCSGCLTSSEELLMNKHHGDLLTSKSSDSSLAVAVSLSPQACSSIALACGISAVEAAGKLATFLRSLGVRFVFSTSVANQMALDEACHDFEERWLASKETAGHGRKKLLPLLCSECPGLTVYIEKTYDSKIVRLLSRVKSPQAIMSTTLKKLLEPRLGGSKVWHCTVMPCLDKKLESARPQLSGASGTGQDTDCVLTGAEMLRFMDEQNVTLQALPTSPLDSLAGLITATAVPFAAHACGNGSGNVGKEMMGLHDELEEMCIAPGGCSGGYLEAVARSAAKRLLGVTLPRHITYSNPRGSNDVRELIIRTAEGDRELRFAAVYGFRHIQTLIVGIQGGSCKYDYVEVMSCPGGCNNGGGQARSGLLATDLQLKAMDGKYLEMPRLGPRRVVEAELLAAELGRVGRGVAVVGGCGVHLRTRYRPKEKTLSSQIQEW